MITETAAAALLQAETLVPSWLPGGKRKGREFVSASVRGGDGDSMSVNLETGMWSDFATGEKGGDLVSLYAAQHGIGQLEAAKAVAAEIGRAPSTPSSKSAAKPTWTPCPGEGGISMPQTTGQTWTYRSADGTPLLVVERLETPAGKTYRPWCWCKSESGIGAWRQKQIPKNRPMYGLPELLANPDSPVMVVEGEKTADAARSMFPTWCVTTWPSGAQSVDRADWSPLQGRLVVIWPDADEPGATAAGSVKRRVPGSAIVELPANLPKGWDLADATPEQHGDCIRRAQEALAKSKAVAKEEIPMPPIYEELELEEQPFRVLGRSDGVYFYMPKSTREVVALRANEHTGKHLLRLAPLSWWAIKAPAKREAVDWQAAQDFLMRSAEDAGRFRADRIRGRGAWLEGEKVVLHLGSHLLVNGAAVSLDKHCSSYIYREADEITLAAEQANGASGKKLIEAFELLALSGGMLAARLLAGWCALAGICGALRWRPHMWLTGKSGGGKTWVNGNLIAPALGDYCLNLQGATTEAGLRQAVGHDAIPVVFDEAEADTPQAMERMRMIMEFARACSAETGAVIIKGSTNGSAMSFRPRAMLLYSSVNASTNQKADIRRTTRIEITHTTPEKFAQVKKLAREIDFAGIRARMVSLAAVVAHNVEIFSDAVMDHVSDRCEGDQLGTLIAGAYALTSREKITKEQAEEWVKAQDWSPVQTSEENDSQACFDFLLAQFVRDGSSDKSIQELLLDEDDEAVAILARHGVFRKPSGVCLRVRHAQINAKFSRTRWADDKWAAALLRIDGAKKHRPYLNGKPQWVIEVPFSWEA